MASPAWKSTACGLACLTVWAQVTLPWPRSPYLPKADNGLLSGRKDVPNHRFD